MNDSKQRKNGVILSYVSIVISIVVQLIYTPFLIRNLGQSEYGLYSLISSIIGYLTVLDLGFGNAIIVYISKYRAQKKYDEEKKMLGMFFVIFCIISFIAVVLGISLYFLVPYIFKNSMTITELSKAKTMMLILTFNLGFTFIFSIYSSIISAYEKFTFQKLTSILSTIMKPIIMIPLLLVGYKSIAMTIVVTIINISILFSNYIYCRKKLSIKIKFNGFNKKIFKEIFGYSFFVFLTIIVDKVNWSIDQFILGAVVGTKEVSIYSIANQLNTIFMNVSSACCSVMLPKLSKMVGGNSSDEQLNNEFIKFGRLQWYVMFLLVSGFIIYGLNFIKIWAGVEYIKSFYVALILILPLSIVLIENIGVYIMQAKNLHKFKSIMTTIMAFFNLIISIFLAKKYGAIGSAIGTSISLVVCNSFIMNVYYYKKVKLNVIKFWRNIIRISIPIFTFFVVWLIFNNYIFKCETIIEILIGAILYTGIYSILAYKYSFNEYEINIVNSFIDKIKGVLYEKNNNR